MASVTKRKWTSPSGEKKEAWAVRYFDEGGRRRAKTFEQKKAADVFRRQVEREIGDGSHVPDADAVTVSAAVEAFNRHTEQRARDGRIGKARCAFVERSLRRHIVPAIGSVRFRDLTALRVEEIYREMTKKGLSPIFGRQVLNLLGLVEQYAERHGYTKSRPVKQALAELRGIKCGKVSAPSIDDAGDILKRCLEPRFNVRRRSAAMLACFIHLAGCCGMRMGEIRALKLANIDLPTGTIKVRHSMTASGEIKGPKSAAGNRDVPVPAHLVAMLRGWLQDYHIANDAGLLFTTPSGKAPTHTDIHARWIGFLKEVGKFNADDPMHFHALRHFAGSWWLHNAMPVAAVSRLLGHSNPAITMQIYAHALVSEQGMRDQVQSATALIPGIGGTTLTHGRLTA